MSSAFDGLRSWLGGVAAAPARPPQWLRVPEQSAVASEPPKALQPRKNYLEVRVARVHLAHERQWFEKYTPLVFAAAELSYDGQSAAAPVVVGPSLLRQMGTDAPLATLLTGTRIAGPVPYQGGGLTLTLVLHRLAAGNILEPFLDALDGASKSLDFVAGLTPYTAVAKVVMDGLKAVTGGTAPLVAVRDERPTADTGYWALIDSDDKLGDLSVRDGELWTRDGQLRNLDYVLCQVAEVDQAEVDVTRLPLHRQWQAVLMEANRSQKSDVWENTKVNMAALIGMISASPDLTDPHAEALRQEWTERMVAAHKDAVRLSELAPAEQAPPSSLDAARSQALAVLDL